MRAQAELDRALAAIPGPQLGRAAAEWKAYQLRRRGCVVELVWNIPLGRWLVGWWCVDSGLLPSRRAP